MIIEAILPSLFDLYEPQNTTISFSGFTFLGRDFMIIVENLLRNVVVFKI